MADEHKCKELEKIMNEKVYFLNELTRKKTENDRELKLIKSEIEKERNKSMADESVIRKLEGILNEKNKQLEGNSKIKKQSDDAIEELRQLLDDERRKSMADEGQIHGIQNILNMKIKEANDFNKKVNDMSRKSDLNDQEVRFLKEEIDKERRKSSADENLVKKLEYLLAEKIKIIDEHSQKEGSLDNDLRNLSDVLQG